MVVQYKRSDHQHQFSLQGEATEKELEALLHRFQELLHPEPGLQVQVAWIAQNIWGEATKTLLLSKMANPKFAIKRGNPASPPV